MKVLMITGDKRFGPGHERYELQRSVVDELAVVYWGRGSLWPKIPAGQFDVVTVQDPMLRGVFGLRVVKKIKARLNVQVHMDLYALSRWRYVLAQCVLRRADSIRVVSQKIQSQVEHMGVRAKVSVLPIFVDVSKFQRVTPRAHTSKNILWIGRFEVEKDPLLAIKVLQKVLMFEPGAHLRMLGLGSMSQEMSKQAERLPVEFLGWQDPAQFLDTADVVLCTSVHESWGASTVEALAAGVPVVAPDVGVAKEAGATVVSRERLAEAIIQTLKEGSRGKLLLTTPTKEEWAQEWLKTL